MGKSEKEAPEISDWDLLWMVMAIQESGVNDTIQNPSSDALGCWQIRKVYVDAANRYQDSIHFTYEDRKDRNKQRLMIRIVQDSLNKEKDIYKAIRIQYTRATDSASAKKVANYTQMTLKNMNLIRKYEQIKREK